MSRYAGMLYQQGNVGSQETERIDVLFLTVITLAVRAISLLIKLQRLNKVHRVQSLHFGHDRQCLSGFSH
ncbi:MAG TPA: hypothetical protein VMU53_17330 [Candidatus Sulfotelmatobacter sp.]|nr:hypothetical protein [Candidatus Sulfotelmatobacter sp.]